MVDACLVASCHLPGRKVWVMTSQVDLRFGTCAKFSKESA